jgi:hypothetical protein
MRSLSSRSAPSKHDTTTFHMPRIFQANAASAIACSLAHNFVRWTLRLAVRWPWRTAWQQTLTCALSHSPVGRPRPRAVPRRTARVSLPATRH